MRVLLILLLFDSTISSAQFGEQQIIDETVASTRGSIAADLNGDGYLDLVTVRSFGNKLVWHQNLDGEGNFSSEQLITEDINGIEHIELADMDSDGDLDIVYLTNYFDKIGWLENLDGAANFGPEQVIIADHYGYSLHVDDLDGDNYPDIFTTMVFEEGTLNVIKFLWLKNEGDGSFTPNFLEENWPELTEVILFDLDGDGDKDMLAGVSPILAPGAFIWYENTDGAGSFGDYNFIFQFWEFTASYQIVFSNISLADIDDDSIPDIVFSVIQPETGHRIYWMKGLESTGGYTDPILIDNPPDGEIIDLQLVDIDNDDDLDLLCGLWDVNDIRWYENLEAPGEFAEARVITIAIDHLTSINSGFIDDDDLVDFFSVSTDDFKIAWYKNLGALNTPENTATTFNLYPNPTGGLLNIDSELPIEKLQVFTVLGQELEVPFTDQIADLSGLTSGLYLLKVTDASGATSTQRVIRN